MRNMLLVMAMAILSVPTAFAGQRKQGEWIIGLSNSFYGNTWRKQSVEAFTEAAEQAKAEGLIKDYIIMNGDGTQNQQIAQMNSLILQQVDAICVNAFSPTALNGVIDRATQAGIKVLAFDSIVTNPNAWTMDFSFVEIGEILTKFLVEKIEGNGNIIIARGISGSAPELQIYEGQMNILKQYPDIKILAEVFTEASSTIGQKAISNILPSLPKIDAVMNQGGDGYGIAMAFIDAGRPVPFIAGGNRAEFIRWWIEQKKENGYETISAASAPGVGGAALWVAINILQGNDVPKKMTLKNFIVTQDAVDEYADITPGTVVSPTYTNEYVIEEIIKPWRNK